MRTYWFEQTTADILGGEEWLSPGEKESLSRLRFPGRRADWLLGRWTAKRALAVWFELPTDPLMLAQFELAIAPTGAPQPECANCPVPVSFSLSHRAGTALCTLASPGIALGCDLELVEARSDAFLADYFTTDEQRALADAAASERDRLVTVLWSAKESALKALHVGLRRDTRDVAVTLRTELGDRQGWSAFEVCAREGRILHGWWQTSGEFVRTVATDVASDPPRPLVSAIREEQYVV